MSDHRIVNLPNVLTLLRIVLTPVFLVALFTSTWYAPSVAFVVFVVASLTDYYDGRLARSGNQVTALGRFMDPLADKILVTAALIGFVLTGLVSVWLVLPVVVRDVLITFLRIRGLHRGRQLVTSRFAKWKTAMQLFTVTLLLFLCSASALATRYPFPGADVLGQETLTLVANLLVAVVLVLTVLSGIQYAMGARFIARTDASPASPGEPSP